MIYETLPLNCLSDCVSLVKGVEWGGEERNKKNKNIVCLSLADVCSESAKS